MTDDDRKSPQEWQAIHGITICDPDGWRTHDAPAWDEPITSDEFLLRAAVSTIRGEGGRAGYDRVTAIIAEAVARDRR